MTSEKHIHMDTTSAAAIEISKRRAPLDSNSYYNLFPGFLCPCVFPLLRALVQQRTRHWCHLVLSQILRANLCHLWTVVKISLSKRGMWLTSDGVNGSEFRFLSFVWSKMLAGLDWDIWEKPSSSLTEWRPWQRTQILCPKGLEKGELTLSASTLMVYLITVIQDMLSLIAASFSRLKQWQSRSL